MTTCTFNETTYYRVVRNGRGRRPTIEIYRFYPDAGPVGTPGRGPYCISWLRPRTADVPDTLNMLHNSGVRPLPDTE